MDKKYILLRSLNRSFIRWSQPLGGIPIGAFVNIEQEEELAKSSKIKDFNFDRSIIKSSIAEQEMRAIEDVSNPLK